MSRFASWLGHRSPRTHDPIVTCCDCAQSGYLRTNPNVPATTSRRMVADLDGSAFRAYFCQDCATRTMTERTA